MKSTPFPFLPFFFSAVLAASLLPGLSYAGEIVENFDDESAVTIANEGENTKADWTVIIPSFKCWQGGMRSVAVPNPSGTKQLEPVILRNMPAPSPADYSVSVDLCLNNPHNTSWAGIVFDYQESGTYFWLRISGEGNVQILRCSRETEADGVESCLFSPGAGGGGIEPEFFPEPTDFHRITLSRKDSDHFSIEVRNPESGEVLYAKEWSPKPGQVPERGRFGLKGNRSTTDFDNFQISGKTTGSDR